MRKNLKYTLYFLGLYILCMMATNISFSIRDPNGSKLELIISSMEDYILCIIYAGLVYGISLLRKKERSFKRFFKILVWAIIINCIIVVQFGDIYKLKR